MPYRVITLSQAEREERGHRGGHDAARREPAQKELFLRTEAFAGGGDEDVEGADDEEDHGEDGAA